MATGDPIYISNFNEDDAFGDATRLRAFAKGAQTCCLEVEKRPRTSGTSPRETAILARCDDGGTGIHGFSGNFLVGGEGVRGTGPVGVLGDASFFGNSVGVRGIAGQNGTGVAGSGERYGVVASGGENGLNATGTGANSNGVTASGGAIGVLGIGTGPSSIGLAGRTASGTGVVGQSTAGVGMIAQGATMGLAAEADDVGIAAEARGGPGSVAVRALARVGTPLVAWTQRGYVMNARSEEGEGVVVGARRHGVLGWSDAAIGVRGQAFGANPLGVRRSGVLGESEQHPGVIGVSQSGAGVEAESATGTALRAHGRQGTGAHITAGLGPSGAPGVPLLVEAPFVQNRPGRAANIIGDVMIRGDLVVAGVKSAVVALADGSQRRLYCVEMPDCWVEDAGEAVLVDGYARVPIDPILQRSIKDYQVFLSAYGPCDAYVAKRSRASFEIRIRGAAPQKRLACGWRLLARRSDVDARRWARVRQTPGPSRARRTLPLPAGPRPSARAKRRTAALPRLSAPKPPKLRKPYRHATSSLFKPTRPGKGRGRRQSRG